jgi:serine/threonine-protein kinase
VLAFGRYELLSRLGSGGMGEVWLARTRGPERVQKTVVVKRLRRDRLSDEAARARFVDEARVAVALSHPHLVPVFELGEEGGEYFLVMEYVRGGDLSRIAGIDRAPLGWAAVALLGSELSDALAYVHGRKDRHGAHLVHRDISPHNVLLSPEGHALLGDFGLASFAPRDHAGTRRYQSPEQARGEPFDGRADLYALALVLCEAATGKPAYDRDGERAAAQAKVGIVPPLDGVEPRLAQVLRRALAASADARPASAAALRDQLDHLLDENPRARTSGRQELVTRVAAAGDGAPGASRSLTEATRAPEPRSRLPILSLLVALAAVAAVWRATRSQPESSPPVPTLSQPVPTLSQPEPTLSQPSLPAPSPAAPLPSPVAPLPPIPVAPQRVRVKAPAPSPKVESASLDLNAVPWAHVRIDGNDRGDTPLLDVVLPAGQHRVELINEPLGVRRELSIELHPGEHARRVETLSR